MTTEEKARAYDEAFERAKGIYKETWNGYILKIFPELSENEEEKIRKEIISALKNANYKSVYDKHIAWLEKQGEKPQVDGFDTELNSLLKKYEHLPKDEILGCLNFYVLVLGKEIEERQ